MVCFKQVWMWFFNIGQGVYIILSPDGLISRNNLMLFSHLVMSAAQSLPHGQQHNRLPCPSPLPHACSKSSCPLSRWCHPAISTSVVHFSSYLQSFPSSGSFLMSQFFTSGDQSIGVSAGASASTLVLPINIQVWFPLELTGLISLQSQGLSRVFSSTTV